MMRFPASLLLIASTVLLFAQQRAPAAPAPEIDSLKLMTFNIRYGTADDGDNRWENRRGLLVELLRKEKCDVMCLQEALHFQLEELVDSLPGYSYAGVGRDDGIRAGEYAAIMYRRGRFTVDTSGTFWLSETPGVPGSRHWGNNVTRICTWARLLDRTSRQSVCLFNLHLDHESQLSREKSAWLLLERIAARPHQDPVIITGDFNAGETNPALRVLLFDGARFVDSYQAIHDEKTDTGTYHAFRGDSSGEKIDFILVDNQARVFDARILHDNNAGRYPSDHFPVTAVLGYQ
jgi:endonuclease/exonuclease/phosphatase family metal-dependent hydrolase